MHLCPTKRCVLRGLCTDLKLILHIAFMTVWAAMHCSRSSISHPLHHCWALLGRVGTVPQTLTLTAYLSAFNTLAWEHPAFRIPVGSLHQLPRWNGRSGTRTIISQTIRELSYHKIIFGQCRVRWSGRRGKPPSRARPAALPPFAASAAGRSPEPPPLARPRLLRGRGPLEIRCS